MKDIMYWEKILKLGVEKPKSLNGEVLADYLVPIGLDMLVIDAVKPNKELYVAPDACVINMNEPTLKEQAEDIRNSWREYYKDVISPSVKQLEFAGEYLLGNKELEGFKYFCPMQSRVHKILVLEDIDEAVSHFFCTNFSGLIYNNTLKEQSDGVVRVCLNKKIKAPIKNSELSDIALYSYGGYKPNVHIMTKQQFEYISMFLPTAQSFVDFLNWKEFYLMENMVLCTDDYTLLVHYLKQGWGNLKPTKKTSGVSLISPIEDKELLEFQESEFALHFILGAKNVGSLLHYLGSLDNLESISVAKGYLLMPLDQILGMTDNLPDIVSLKDGEKTKTSILYGNEILYIFHGVRSNSYENDDVRDLVGVNITSGVTYDYLQKEEIQKNMPIRCIVTSVLHKDTTNNLYTSFIALWNLLDLKEDTEKMEVLQKIATTSPIKLVDLEVMMAEKVEKEKEIVQQIVKIKKVARNELCPCNSGRKFKHCCGK